MRTLSKGKMEQYRAIELVSRPLKKTRYRLNKGSFASSFDEIEVLSPAAEPSEKPEEILPRDKPSPGPKLSDKELARLKKAADRVAKRETKKEEKLLKKKGIPVDPEEEYVKKLKEKALAMEAPKEKRKNSFSFFEDAEETDAEKRRREAEEEINFDGYYSPVPPLDDGLDVKRTKKRLNKETLKFAAAILILLLIAIVCLIKVLL